MARKHPRPSPRKEFPKRRDRAEGEARPNPHALAAEAERAAADLPALEPLDEHSLLDLLDSLEAPPFLLVLDQVQDPHNLGACLRSADAAGVHAIIVPKDRSAPLSHTVRMIATGAAETVPVARVTNLARTLADLKERNLWIVGTAEDAPQALWDIDLKGPIALVLGSEGSGLRRLTREACDFMASLPMAGRVGSLNVSVAAGVCLFEALRQRRGDSGAG